MRQNNPQIWDLPTPKQLAALLTVIDSVPMMQDFLRDVLTEKEIIEISSRLEAAKMLQAGCTYNEIVDRTKLSSRTIARISEWMQRGNGGYQAALKLVTSHHDHILPASAD